MQNDDLLVEIKDLKTYFFLDQGTVKAVDGVNLNVPRGRTIDLVGRLTLTEAAAALARCALYIGNDSGLMHLAAAAGAPTVGLFGPSPPEDYAPCGPHTAVARTRVPMAELIARPDYDHRTTGSLMGSLPVEDAVAAASALLARLAPAAAQ